MNRFSVLVAALAVLLLASCGGGGAGGGGGVIVLVRIELPNQDPINIVNGQVVTFVLATYDDTGHRSTVVPDSWSISQNPGIGSIDSTGKFTAAATGNARIRATWINSPLFIPDLNITVRPTGLARLSGSVRNDASSAAVANVTVVFFDNGNIEVGRAISQTNGSFLAQVPTTATRMNLDQATLSGWLLQWKYRVLVYQAGNGIPNCHATIVTTPLVANQTSIIADPVRVISIGSPPPFPSGCGP
jgi:hypothetical protein